MNRRHGETVTRWLTQRAGAEEIPPHVRLAYGHLQREEEAARLGKFAEPFRTDEGLEGNAADLVPQLHRVAKQFELKLPPMDQRAHVRRELARVIEERVIPLTTEPWIRKVPARLREARQKFSFGYRPRDDATRIMWDAKAGLSRLCPDDAREETQRFTRRVMDPLEAMRARGLAFTYCVFTLPNAAPGKLRPTMQGIFRRLVRTLRAKRPRVPGAPRSKRAPAFPGIEGAIAVLEAPLSRLRDWNVHVNVILAHRGFLDWRLMRELWHWNVHFDRIRGDREELQRSLRELIKYSARAVAEKSIDKADQGEDSPPGEPEDRPADPLPRHGPPMVEWSGVELLEWLEAFKKFRRTRTYGALYRLPDPEPEDAGGFLWVGHGELAAGRYTVRFTPLDSIPGDKSLTADALERWRVFVARLKGKPPPGSATSSAANFA